MLGKGLGRIEYGALVAAFGLALLFGSHTGATGATTDLTLLLALAFLAGVVGLTIAAPHVLFAAAIPIFAAIPMLKLLFVPWIGPLKDAIVVGAVIGSVIVAFQRRLAGERQPADGLLVCLVGAFLGLYVLNLGAGMGAGAYGGQWQQGVRLTAEPLLLLLVGLTLRGPEKVLRWSLASLLSTTVVVALYGLYQQKVGQWGLRSMGYEFDVSIRTINGHLRSFGTLDDPFAYAAFLLMGLAVLMFVRMNRWLAVAVGSFLLAGLAVAYVRTSAVILVALGGLWLARKGHGVVSILLLGCAAAAAIAFLANSSASKTRTVQAGPSTYLSINGRTGVWKDVLNKKSQWPLGKGVGAIGTAADRAKFGVYKTQQAAATHASKAVDSGYLAVVADVGFLGLAVFLSIVGRLGQLCFRFARKGIGAGWIGGALLLVMLLDSATRASFTGFPAAFLGMFLVGVAINAARNSTETHLPRP